MNNIKICLTFFILPLFLSTSFLKKTNTISKRRYNSTTDLRANSNVSAYEVRFTFTGYTTFYVGPPDCPVRPNGRVVLSGLLSGAENVASDDDIVYKGTLQLKIDMDICSAMRLPNGEDKFCVMTVTGSGPVKTQLELYFNGPGQDSARGGYIKFNYEPSLGTFQKSVTGDCEVQQVTEEQQMVPNKTIASIFNGYELPMLTDRTLRVKRYVVRGESGETVVEVLRKLQ